MTRPRFKLKVNFKNIFCNFTFAFFIGNVCAVKIAIRAQAKYVSFAFRTLLN